MTKKMKVLYERVWNGEQSWFLERIFASGNHRFRMKFRFNAYVDQSYGRIERWDGGQWRDVHSIPGECLGSGPRYVEKNVSAKSFPQKDIDELISVALAVVAPSKNETSTSSAEISS